ncbi:MAG: hypothetical protein IKP64_14370 [Selenomonadaceae bacterium]|nr:hypothetical protein [Selenomonadaceae bacterium]
MLKKIFCAALMMAAILFVGNTKVSAAPQNPNLDRVLGTYVGSYTIPSSMKRGLKLTVYRQDGQYEASFEFYGLPGRAKSARGRYFMTVAYDSSQNAYLFHGYEWVERPSGYVFVDLRGALEGSILSGDVFYNVENLNSVCGTFYLERVR